MEAWREELYHHGIQGQKWGVRRFQNPDGSLTEAGKRRISSNDVKNAAKTVQKGTGVVMETYVDGRKMFANKEERIARGKQLKGEGRTMVGAYGRYLGRNIVAGALAYGVSALCANARFEIGQEACRHLITAYGVISTARLVQDVRDIAAYNKSMR